MSSIAEVPHSVNPLPGTDTPARPFRFWKGEKTYQQKVQQNIRPEGRMPHIVLSETVVRKRSGTNITPLPPDAVAVIAGLPAVTISALMQVIAGPHRTDSSTHNAQMCADVVERRGCTLAEAESVYAWALEVEADLGRVGAGEPAQTPWGDMLWDYSIGLSTLARTAQFISEMAQGLTGKGGTK